MRSPGLVAGEGQSHDTETPDVHTSSDAYARRFLGAGRLALERQDMAFRRLLASRSTHPFRVLDLGGGHLQLLSLLREYGHDVIVHGSRPGCFVRLDARQAAELHDIDRCVSSLFSLPFADASVDLIVGIRLLAHVERWRELLDEMCRVSRRYVLVDFPVHAGAQRWSTALFAMKQRIEKSTRPFFLYERDTIIAHLRARGADCVGAVGEFVLPLTLHRALHAPWLTVYAERAFAAVGLASRIGSPVMLLAEKHAAPQEIPS
jgi:ubiquinone/menaquinone biosynthesis C-methylase UbiE